jgi:hypothetical protein
VRRLCAVLLGENSQIVKDVIFGDSLARDSLGWLGWLDGEATTALRYPFLNDR